jgi:hypothetical protein
MRTARPRTLEELPPRAPVFHWRGREGADPNVLARALLAAMDELPSDKDPTIEVRTGPNHSNAADPSSCGNISGVNHRCQGDQ